MDADAIRAKAKRRKRMTERCEMSTGWHSDTSGHPVIDMCTSRATKFYPEFGHFGVYLCDEHFESRLTAG